MPKKSFKKKKAFQRFCQAQVKKGMVNNALGEWKSAGGGTMDRMMVAGYHLK